MAGILVDGVVIADDHGRITYMNPAALEMFGLRELDALGQPLTRLMPERYHQAHAHGFDRFVATGEARVLGKRLELTAQRQDGTEFPMELTLSHYAPQGRHVFVAVVRDITKRRALELQSVEGQKQVRELDYLRHLQEFKTHFINKTAHELTTPLTPVMIQLTLLEQAAARGDPLGANKAVEVLGRSLRRLSELVNDIVFAARLQSRELGLRREDFDLRPVVRRCVDELAARAETLGVSLETRCASGAFVNADPVRIAQVVTHLVTNGIKFNHPGGRVLVECHKGEDGVVVQVVDTGFGIPRERREAIFQPYARTDTAGDRGAGSGLGLYICKGILELHGGSISCESAGPGTGSTFSFSLPTTDASPQARLRAASSPVKHVSRNS